MIPGVPARKSWFNVPKTPGGSATARTAAKFGHGDAPAEPDPIRTMGAFRIPYEWTPERAIESDQFWDKVNQGREGLYHAIKSAGLSGATGHPRGGLGHTGTYLTPVANHMFSTIAAYEPWNGDVVNEPDFQGLNTHRSAWEKIDPENNILAGLTDRDLDDGYAMPESFSLGPGHHQVLFHPDDLNWYRHHYDRRGGTDPWSEFVRKNAEGFARHGVPLGRWLAMHEPGFHPQTHRFWTPHAIPPARLLIPRRDVLPRLGAHATLAQYLQGIDRHARREWHYHGIPMEQIMARAQGAKGNLANDLGAQASVYRDKDAPGYRKTDPEDGSEYYMPGNPLDEYKKSRRRVGRSVAHWRVTHVR